MTMHGISRRRFFYGSLLAGAVPAGGFFTPSLKALGYKSPNEKLNVAAIGAGSQPFNDLRNVYSNGEENVVALADCDWARGAQGFQAFPNAAKHKDFRRMLDQSGKEIDAVVIGPADHMHAICAIACMQLGKHVYVEKPLTRTAQEARLMAQAAEKYKVATQMGNQGYSHDATRVACEIFWSGEIGEVREVHAWTGRASWPQEMTKIPPPTPVPETLDWDLWLGGAEFRPYTVGDQEYQDFILARAARNGRGGGAPGAAGRGTDMAGRGGNQAARGGAGAAGGAVGQGGAAGRGGGGAPFGPGGMAPMSGGFYMPFNWRGFYDFGSSLIGDWGVHILGPANWALQLHPQYLISVECIKKDMLPPFTFPDEVALKYEFAARPGMPPVTIYWYHTNTTPYMPPGMTVEEARKIPGAGPQVGPGRGQGGFFPGSGGTPTAPPGGPGAGGRAAAGAPGAAQGGAPGGAPGGPPGAVGGAGGAGRGAGGPGGGGLGYNCIFVGSKGFLGTNGRGEDVGLLPGKRWADYKLPNAYLPRSPGASTGDDGAAHARDWVRACKGGAAACSNFSIAGPYTEWLILGSAAIHAEGACMWDNAKGEFSNHREVNKWVKPTFRKGWEIKV